MNISAKLPTFIHKPTNRSLYTISPIQLTHTNQILKSKVLIIKESRIKKNVDFKWKNDLNKPIPMWIKKSLFFIHKSTP